MRNLKHNILVFIVSVIAISLTGCGRVKDITVTSVKLESIAPQGLKGINVYLAVGIDNPAFQIGLEDIHGALKHSGKVLGRMTMAPFVLHARSTEIYHLKTTATIEQGVTLMELMTLTDMETLNKCTVDVSVRATLKGGISKVLRFNDIPMTDLL